MKEYWDEGKLYERKENNLMGFKTKKEYINRFSTELEEAVNKCGKLKKYTHEQFEKLDKLETAISSETFWRIIPEILGIDAKLCLLVEFCQYDEFSSEEIIGIIENDYRNYHKELCGYSLNMEPTTSLIFNVS
ncbi:DUF7006 family protein [Enterococcus sp. DIV0008]|uniref:DUF7006 family protein n=1 Tax=unclassified Enterococcus TaxID=2608891 RepID=UPI003D300220